MGRDMTSAPIVCVCVCLPELTTLPFLLLLPYPIHACVIPSSISPFSSFSTVPCFLLISIYIPSASPRPLFSSTCISTRPSPSQQPHASLSPPPPPSVPLLHSQFNSCSNYAPQLLSLSSPPFSASPSHPALPLTTPPVPPSFHSLVRGKKIFWWEIFCWPEYLCGQKLGGRWEGREKRE